MDELVHLDVSGAVATITLDSPENRNALSERLVTQLCEHLATAGADDAVHAVVIAAEGSVFCSGADLKEAVAGGMEHGARTLVDLQRRIVALDKPVLVRLQGPVRAGGLGIVGAADVVVCADTVTFAFTEVLLGLAPAVISLTTLPRLTSRDAARTFLTGATFGAAEAERMGLVTSAVPPEQLDAAVASVVEAWTGASGQGLRETKRLLNHDLLERIDELGDSVARQSAELFGSPAAISAMQAFFTRKR